MKHTPLYEEHKRLDAKLVDFAGWEMPVEYKGIAQEHKAVRESAGLFDVSHMGEFFFTGGEALQAVQYLTTNDASKLYDGKAHYSLLCNEQGTIIDDIIVYRFTSEKFMFVVNASNREKDFNWCKNHLKPNTTIKDSSDDLALLALQGPKATLILQKITTAKLNELKKFHFITTEIDSVKNIVVARTGYTGEDGFEIFIPPAHAPKIWNSILESGKEFGIQPVGLGARDTLRLEMKYSLYGNDISEETNPLEAGLGWVVKFDCGDFIGRERLLEIKQKGLSRKSIGFEMIDKGIPRHGYSIVVDGKSVGVVTSGTFSPTLESPIGIGFLPQQLCKDGTIIEIDIRNKMKKAKVVPTPFLHREL